MMRLAPITGSGLNPVPFSITTTSSVVWDEGEKRERMEKGKKLREQPTFAPPRR